MIRFYDSPSPPEHHIRFLTYPPCVHVCIPGGPASCVAVYVHWRGRHSVPCRGEECLDCPQTAVPFGYAPAMLGLVSGRRFVPVRLGILPVTGDALELVLEDHRGQVLSVTRSANKKHGSTIWDTVECTDAYVADTFDLLPRLMRVWHLRDEELVRQVHQPGETGPQRPFGVVSAEGDELAG